MALALVVFLASALLLACSSRSPGGPGRGAARRPWSTRQRHGRPLLRRRAQGVRADRRARPTSTSSWRPASWSACSGPSGCGKTTALRIAAGFEWPDAGVVRVGGVDISNTPPNKRNMGMVFQSYSLFPNLNVAGQRGLRAAHHVGRQGGAHPAGGRDARAGPAAGVRRPLPAPALGRPAAAGGAGPGAGHLAQRCCCSTSRSRRSTPRSACCCATRSAASRPSSASRPCSSPTTRRRRSASPTASA